MFAKAATKQSTALPKESKAKEGVAKKEEDVSRFESDDSPGKENRLNSVKESNEKLDMKKDKPMRIEDCNKNNEIDVKENGASKSKKINSSVSQDLKKRKSNVKSVDSQSKRRKRIQVNMFIITKK